MPQIDFQPPLATTTTVHLPPLSVLGSAKDSHVTLSFIARPIDGLAEDDVVEIWTDGGTPGSWRAVPFESYGEEGILVAQIPVDIADGSFGFTYRVTHASGDATWLGDMGGNGKIDLISTGGEDALWKGEDWLKFDQEHWTGFGVHLDDKNLASGIHLPAESSDLSFAYLHPAATPPFATFHPTISSITSTAFGLVSTTGSILAASTNSLAPTAQPSESGASTGPPAAYASYCGLGFSGGEQERSKAFRSLLGLANHGLQYLPCTLDGTKGKDTVHAVGLLSLNQDSGKPDRLITYLAGTGSAEWDVSSIVQEDSVALWDAKSKHAQTITTKPTVLLTCESSPVVQTLQIVHLFEFSKDGSQTFIGVLDDSPSKSQWKFSPERTETEEFFVDEVVSSPAPEKGGKTLGETSDSGETVESSGITSDFTSDADMETLGTSVEDVDEETIGKKVNADVAENQQAPVAGSDLLEPEATEDVASNAALESDEPTNEPASAPKKSLLRFFWITLSLLNSLWWGTVSWFRQWTSKQSTETIASAEQDDQPDVEDEQTPLIREVDASQNYASVSQETLQPDVTEPVEGATETPTEAAEPPVESQIETIRVPETRKTVFPAQISASAFSHDVFLLTNAPTASDLVGEIRSKDNVGEWQSVALVEEKVALTSELKLLRLPLNIDAEIRIRLA